jgi:hypothetical protein
MTKMTATENIPHRFRSVIFLNNVACLLSEKSSHRLAHQTLQDALVVIKLVCSSPYNSLDDASCKLIETKLHLADQRLSGHYASPTSQRLTSYIYHSDAPTFRSILMIEDSSEDIYHPIRIEVNGSQPETLEPDALTAILLYNYAISSLLKANLEAALLPDVQARIIRMFLLTNNILSLCESHAPILFISLACCDAMARVLCEMGSLREAEVYIKKVAELKSVAQVLQRIEDVGLPKGAPAA